MRQFVIGATGSIGVWRVKKLLQRKGAVVYFLPRQASADNTRVLREFCGTSAARLVLVWGDLTTQKLGLTGTDIQQLKGQADHFYHLAVV